VCVGSKHGHDELALVEFGRRGEICSERRRNGKQKKKELTDEKKRLKYMLYNLLKFHEPNKKNMNNIMRNCEE
jgi:hypothetical protein